MFHIGDKAIAPGSAFEHGGVLYPANWHLFTQEERAAIGIVETPDEPPVDSRFYFAAGSPRPAEQIVARYKAEIKTRARAEILSKYPEWKQTNMTARGVELVYKAATGGQFTAEEQTEAAALQSAWAEIKALRAHSDSLEAEVAELEFEDLVAWQQYGWPEHGPGA